MVGTMQKGFIEEVAPVLAFEGKVREWEVSHSRQKEELGGSRKGVILGMWYLHKPRQSHWERARLTDLGFPHCTNGNGSGTVYFHKASNRFQRSYSLRSAELDHPTEWSEGLTTNF